MHASLVVLFRHCEEQSDEAIQSYFYVPSGLLRGACHRARIRATRWLAMTAAELAARYSETVCTTLLTGRVLATGSFMSWTRASSYSGKVCSGALAFICTTL